jgi:hypothetical protein
MATATANFSEQPPSYVDATDNDVNEILQPTILVLAGQSIHAESAASAPLYQLDRGIASLGHATQQVEFERVDRTIKTSSDGEPSIKPRARHIYNLKHQKNSPGGIEPLPSYSPHYFIKSVSRKTLGDVGIKKSHFRSQWKALSIDALGKQNDRGIPQFIKDNKPLFEIHQKNDRYEWTDADGNAIAVEDEGEDQHRLVITASLHRETMDALVALWCCRIWQYSADHEERPHEGLERGKSTLFIIKPGVVAEMAHVAHIRCYSEEKPQVGENGRLEPRITVLDHNTWTSVIFCIINSLDTSCL